MKIKIYLTFILGLIIIGTLCGCGTSTNGMESAFEELDVDYTTNEDGTYGKCTGRGKDSHEKGGERQQKECP